MIRSHAVDYRYFQQEKTHVQTALMLQELQDTCVQASSAHKIFLRFLSTMLADLPSAVVEFLMHASCASWRRTARGVNSVIILGNIGIEPQVTLQ